MLIFFFTKTQNCSICMDFAEGLSSQRGSDSTTHLSCPAEIRYSDSYRTVLKQVSPAQPPGNQARAPPVQAVAEPTCAHHTDQPTLRIFYQSAKIQFFNLFSCTLDLDCVQR